MGDYLSDSGVGTTTLTLTSAVSYLGFYFGTPDTYNVLTVNGVTYHGSDFGFVDNGVPGTGGYVQFMGTNGSLISTLTYSNSPNINAFETSNYTDRAVRGVAQTSDLRQSGSNSLLVD